MKLDFFTEAEIRFVKLNHENPILYSLDQILDLMATASYHYTDCIIISESSLSPDFFDLKTGLAGEVLQKFSTYNQRLAVLGDFSRFKSSSLQAFIRESNRQGRILFVDDIKTAIEILSKTGYVKK